MHITKKGKTLITALGLGLSLLGGNVMAKETLTIGTDLTYPPYNYLDGKTWTRYSISIWDINKTVEETRLQHPALFPQKLVERLIRIYTKQPGKKFVRGDPFTLPTGSTLFELTTLVHKDFAEGLKSAKIWGTGVFDGQTVKRDHVLHDRDIVELHL